MNGTGTPKREKRLSVRDVRVGEKLPWPVFDRNGLLLLPKGTLISTKQQVERLLSNHGHLYISLPQGMNSPGRRKSVQKMNTFTIVRRLLDRLSAAFNVLTVEGDDSFTRRIMQLVCDIQAVCDENADAIMGTMHLIYDAPHGLVHPLHAGILCEVSCRRMGRSSWERFPMVAAALTHDVGLYEIQQELFEQCSPLSLEQRTRINAHPKLSYDILCAQGITDTRWLEAVLHHHERLDGSGYPAGIRGDQISPDSRLLAIVDCYSAMIRPRVYRTRILPQDALKEIFHERGNTIDEELARMFIKAMGIFSPGSLVEFESGTIGVVTGKTDKINKPKVALLTKPNGKPLKVPEIAIADGETDKIVGMVCMLEHRPLMNLLMDQLTVLWPEMSALSDS